MNDTEKTIALIVQGAAAVAMLVVVVWLLALRAWDNRHPDDWGQTPRPWWVP